jgi:DNA polymerase-3 subunit delta'
LLKILEEPAPHTYFLLVTNAADKLLQTIISRTQIVTIPLLDDQSVETHLTTAGVEAMKAARITQLAEGSLNAALKLTDSEEDDNSGRFTDWMRACFKKSYGSLVSLSESYHALDKMRQRNLMLYSMNMMRETLLRVAGTANLNRTRGEELKFIQDFSRVMDVEKIERSYTLMNDAAYHLERNGSAKMIFLDLSLQLSKTINP